MSKTVDISKNVKGTFKKMLREFKKIAKLYEVEYMPINTIEGMVKGYYLDVTLPSNKGKVREFTNNYNNTIDLLVKCCKETASTHPSGKVPINILYQYINQIINNI